MSLRSSGLLHRRTSLYTVKRSLLLSDTFQGSTAITLTNHQPDYVADLEATTPWQQVTTGVTSPSEMFVGGAIANTQNQAYNSVVGTARAYYIAAIDINSPAYRVSMTARHISAGQVGGFIAKVAVYAQPGANTAYLGAVYYDDRDAVTSGVAGTPGWVASLEKIVAATSTVLQRVCIVSTGTPSWPVETKTVLEVLPDGTKILSVALPGETVPTRRCDSTDVSISDSGFPGIWMDRCDTTHGSHPILYEVDARPKPADAVIPGGDPTQISSLLWTPDYANNVGSNLQSANGQHNLWYREQEPYLRGTRLDRITIVGGGNVPGTGTFKPANAMRVELHSKEGPTNAFIGSGGDRRITSTAASTAGSTTLSFSSADVALLFNKDFLLNERTKEYVRINAAPTGSSVTVLRAQKTTATAINLGDTWFVPCGDVSDSGSSTNAYVTSRAEVLARAGTEYGASTPAQWPDPQHSVRWYGVSYYVDPSWPGNSGYSGTNPWTTLTQWKGANGSSPPRSMEIIATSSKWRMGGGGGRDSLDLGAMTPGTWTRFVFGFRWETDVTGWLKVYRDGNTTALIDRNEATMDIVNGSVDPTYLKEGIYRTGNWMTTHIIYYSPIKVGTTMADVWSV